MPWFPDFYNAVELARIQTRTAGHTDPVKQYFTALNHGDSDDLETVWPGEVVVYDPRAGEVRGHDQLRRFVQRSRSVLAEHLAGTDTVASIAVGDRAVVELLAHMAYDGRVPILLQPMDARRTTPPPARHPRARACSPG